MGEHCSWSEDKGMSIAFSDLLRVEDVGKRFGGKLPVEALRDVSIRVGAGDFVSIVGPSGCGKRPLFNLIAGLDAPTSGSVVVAGEDATERRTQLCGYMFQKDLLFPWRTVL